MNKYHRETHTSEHTRRVWDVTSMRRSTIVERNERILSTKTQAHTTWHSYNTTGANSFARGGNGIVGVHYTCESSPTATHTAVNERSVPLFCSVAYGRTTCQTVLTAFLPPRFCTLIWSHTESHLRTTMRQHITTQSTHREPYLNNTTHCYSTIPTRSENITQSSAPDNGHMVALNMLSN